MRCIRIIPLLTLSVLIACSDPGTAHDTDAGSSSGTTQASTGSSTDTPTTGPVCQPGEVVCEGDSAQACGESGQFGPPETCPVACVDGLGCVACVPGSFVCDGDALVQCGEDGMPGDVVTTCDPLQGLTCDPDAGGCTGACAFDPARPADLGCEFWAVPLPTIDGFSDGYGVGIANPCDVPANVSVEFAGVMIVSDAVPPAAGAYFELPRVVALAWVEKSVVVPEAAFRIRTDCPVGVVQLGAGPGEGSADAARLYPTARWGRDAVVATQETIQLDPGFAPLHSYLAVVPRDDATTVTVDAPAGIAVKPVDGIGLDGNGVVVLDRTEVLLLAAELGSDLSGVIVAADGPIQVFGGHECANVPPNESYCDHLEEVMPPTAALGDKYLVVPPMGWDQSGSRVEHVVRVLAIEDGTSVWTTDPNLAGMLDRGEFVEFGPLLAPVAVQSSAPVLVAQYHVGRLLNFFASDPSLLTPAPVDQFRPATMFWTAEDWPLTLVDVVAPTGTMVTLDGAPITGFSPLGGIDGFEAATAVVSAPGAHVINADHPVGVSVYANTGDSQSTASYAYAGPWNWPAP